MKEDLHPLDPGYWSQKPDVIDLRDLFAGLVMAGYLSSAQSDVIGREAFLAKWSYSLAEAMMKERAVRKKQGAAE